MPPTPPSEGVKFDLEKQVIFQAVTNSRRRKFRTFARIFIRDVHRPCAAAIASMQHVVDLLCREDKFDPFVEHGDIVGDVRRSPMRIDVRQGA